MTENHENTHTQTTPNSNLRNRADAFQAEAKELGGKTRRYASELWVDSRTLAKSGFDLGKAYLVEAKNKVVTKKAVAAGEPVEEGESANSETTA